jgi:nucleoside-diphosphate-sugar epimerase
MKRLFFTGATGTLAPFLIHRLLHEGGGETFVCLVRSGDGAARLERRIATICPGCAARVRGPRFVFVSGDVVSDVADPGPLDAIWHFASDLRMEHSAEKAVLAANVGGTERMLALARRSGATLFHVSTAYVAGARSGRVAEGDLMCGQTFRNSYESSKARAEVLVREAMRSQPAVVFRPSIVIGDTRTGVSLTFQGFYKVLWAGLRLHKRLTGVAGSLLGLKGKEFALTLPCASLEDRVNLVAAEYETDLLFRLHRDPRAVGRTFHVVNPDPPDIGQLFDVFTELIGLQGVRIVPASEAPEETLASVKLLNEYVGEQIMVYFPYMAENHPDFDMSNVAELLGGVPPHPRLDHAAWERLFQYAVDRDFAPVY